MLSAAVDRCRIQRVDRPCRRQPTGTDRVTLAGSWAISATSESLQRLDRVYRGCMAVPHVEGDRPNKRWGAEVAFDDLDAIVTDPGRLDDTERELSARGAPPLQGSAQRATTSSRPKGMPPIN